MVLNVLLVLYFNDLQNIITFPEDYPLSAQTYFLGADVC